MKWQLQEAKNKLSKVVQDAQVSGPQVISVRGKEMVVVLSMEQYRRLTGKQGSLKRGSLISFLKASPWVDVELDIERSKDIGREVSL